MKRKLTLFILSTVCAAFCALGAVACDSNDENDSPQDNTPNITYLSKDELYFASGCDYTVIENYFKENGIGSSSYTISSSKDYGAFSNGSSIKYTPEDKEIQVIYVYTENQSDSYSGILYQYTYKGAIKAKLNQPLTEAQYLGEYVHEAYSLSSGRSGYYSAGFTFRNVQYISLTETANYNNIVSQCQITSADNWASANRMFDKEATGRKCYERIAGCLTALEKLFKDIDKTYKIADKYISPDTCKHIVVTDKGYDATCLETGLTDGSHCKLCNSVLAEKQVIPANGHTPVIDKGNAATCIENGLTDGTHCSVCDTILLKQEVIIAGHNYVDRKCTVCNKLEPSKGLEFSLMYSSDIGQYYGVSGIGSCVDTCLVIPDTYNDIPVKSIGSNAIKGNTIIEKVIMLDNIVSIQSNAFNGCTNLNEIVLPTTLTTIGSSAFYNTGYYNNSDNWDNNVLYIDNYLIKADTEITGSYTIKSGTTVIAEYAFNLCEKITSIIMPNSVLYIGNSAFFYCSELSSVELSNKLLRIGGSAFFGCDLDEISLPKTLQKISEDAVAGIRTINYEGTKADWNSIINQNSYWGSHIINCSNGTI